jgi:hypothetical protein
MISTTCGCGTPIEIEFDGMLVEGVRVVQLPGIMTSVAHGCGKGEPVVVPGKLIGFYEFVDGKRVAAKPIVTDAFDSAAPLKSA